MLKEIVCGLSLNIKRDSVRVIIEYQKRYYTSYHCMLKEIVYGLSLNIKRDIARVIIAC